MPAVNDDALRRLPKAELHVHLDGSLRPATVEELARELDLVPADAPQGAAMARVRVTRRAGLTEALQGFELLLPLLQTKEHLARVTRELVEDLAADGVVYGELRLCPRLSTTQGLTVDEVLATVGEAAAQAEAATGTRVALLACMMGGVDPDWNRPVLEAAIRRIDAGVVGVDLAGPVEDRSPDWIDAHAAMFEHARASGLCVTIHAGEAEPPAAIRTALDRYLADRIGHATSLAEDPDLLAEVVERRVVLECCPRSNYWTRTEAELPTLADHPVGRLLEAGARVCLNTDDRTLFGNDLSSEYRVVADAQGLDDRQVAALAANGFAGAFHPGRAAAALGRAVDQLDDPSGGPARPPRTPPGVGPVTATLGFTPADPAFVADPYPAYARLREAGRVLYDPDTDHWLVPHHADVNALLRDRRFGRTYLHVATHAEMGRPEEPDYLGPFWHLIRNGMLDREPPDHTRLRRLVAKAFTPRMVERLRDRVQERVDRLVDGLADAGGGDLVAGLAEPLSVAVISDLLGIPEADRPLLRPWSARICGMYEVNPTEEAGRVASRASTEFSEYLRGLSRERRARPADDLITALTQVVDGGDQLTEDELIGTVVLLLNAGHEATVNFTGIGWWQLFRHPDQLARLRQEPGLVPRAIDELLRYDTPLQMFERWVLEDVEICGVAVPKGAELGLLFGSANRDPAVFADPDRLDLGRPDAAQHLSFGAGVHYCLGAPLGRLELELSFGTLLRRLPAMAPAADPAWKPTYILRGLEALHVAA